MHEELPISPPPNITLDNPLSEELEPTAPPEANAELEEIDIMMPALFDDDVQMDSPAVDDGEIVDNCDVESALAAVEAAVGDEGAVEEEGAVGGEPAAPKVQKKVKPQPVECKRSGRLTTQSKYPY